MSALWLILGFVLGYAASALPIWFLMRSDKGTLELRLQQVEEMYDDVQEQVGQMAGVFMGIFEGEKGVEKGGEKGAEKGAENEAKNAP